MNHTDLRSENRSLAVKMIRFSIPLIFSAILQQLYNWADALIVGNVEGELALGAIGGTTIVSGVLLVAVMGFSIGINVLSAQRFGKGEKETIGNILNSFSVMLGVVFLVLAFSVRIFLRRFLTLLNTPADTFDMAYRYLRIILCGIPFMAVYNVHSAVVTGIGDTKLPFYSVLTSSVCNVLLDLLFVMVLRRGIEGAAFATVISQALMTVFMIVLSRRRHPMLRSSLRFDPAQRDTLREGFRLGIPPMLQYCVTSCGNLILQNFMNGFGTTTVIAITTSYRVDQLALIPVINMATAISTLVAQAWGAKDPALVRRTRNTGIALMLGVSAALTLLVITFGGQLIALFGAGPEAVLIGRAFFIRLASFYIMFGFYNAVRGFLEGIGDVRLSSLLGISMLAIRIICSYAFAPLWGNMVIAYAEGIAWTSAAILFFARMRNREKILDHN